MTTTTLCRCTETRACWVCRPDAPVDPRWPRAYDIAESLGLLGHVDITAISGAGFTYRHLRTDAIGFVPWRGQ